MGQDLFSLKERPYFWVSSYTENALVGKSSIGIFDVLGFLTWRDQNYRKISKSSDELEYWQALRDLNFYLKK